MYYASQLMLRIAVYYSLLCRIGPNDTLYGTGSASASASVQVNIIIVIVNILKLLFLDWAW